MNQTEDQLIEKAITVIDQVGYEELSLRKLTSKLGLTTGAFYKHFSNKEELFKKVIAKLSEQFVSQLTFTTTSPKEQLLQIANYYVKQMQEHPNTMAFLLFSPLSVGELKKENSSYPFLIKMRQLISEIDIDTKLSKQDFFIQIWSFIQGYSFLIKNNITNYNPQLIQTTLSQIMERG